MHSPAAALTWEIWRRHRNRLLAIACLILGFAMFYPSLCANLGLDPDSPNALDSIAQQMRVVNNHPNVLQLLVLVIATCAPLGCMIMTLLYLVSVFTFTDANPKEPFSFPARLFTLPISTRFLAGWLMSLGSATIVAAYLGWTRLVHLPHIDVFDRICHDCLTWVTLMLVSQAIVWALNAFPFVRVLLLSGAAFCLLAHPDFQWYQQLEPHRTPFLLSLLLAAGGVAYLGLSKIRHGSWQTWTWRWWRVFTERRVGIGGPKTFQSPGRAQFWFEWRQTRKLFYCVCVVSVVPVLLMIPCFLLYPGADSADNTAGLMMYLLAVPPFIHLCHGVSHVRVLPQFQAIQPITNGEMAMAQWKAVALSAVLSWGVTLFLLGVVVTIGDKIAMVAGIYWLHQLSLWVLVPAILIGLVFWTWSLAVDRVWVGLMHGTWIYQAYFGLIMLAVFGGMVAGVKARNPAFRTEILAVLPGLFGGLVILKFILAQWAFRVSLTQRLLTPSAMKKYLVIWITLVLALVLPTLAQYYREKWLLSLLLGIILILPLARIGYAPIAMDRGRHE